MRHQERAVPSSVGDLAALGKLIEEHRPKLGAMLQRRIDPVLSARLDAGDLLNETFLVAHRRWNGFKEQCTPTPFAWLYGIAMDCLIEAWRRETRACRDPDREMPWPERSSIQLALSLVYQGTGPSTAICRQELQQKMRRTLRMLGPRDQEILWMRNFDGLSFPEAAQMLNITENAATVRYVRALRRLKDLWLTMHPEV